MKVLLACAAAVIFLCALSSPVSASFEGPIQTRNLFPLSLHLDQPFLEKAATESSMSYSLSHSSTYVVQDSDDWDIGLDMEITEINFIYRRTVRDLFEISAAIPVIITGGGFMDNFVENFHKAFGFSDYGRRGRPHNEFLYSVSRDGAPVISGKSGTRLGDIRLAVKQPLLSSDGYRLSVQGSVEVPVSSSEQGFSNGSLDGGASLLLDAAVTERVMTFWNVGGVFPGDVRGHERVNVRNYFHAGAAVEMMLGRGFSGLVQVQGQSGTYPDTGVDAVDGWAYLIAFGGRYQKEGRVFDLSLTEDLNTTGVPDFIINLTYKFRL